MTLERNIRFIYVAKYLNACSHDEVPRYYNKEAQFVI